jgi:hypothetical protein
MIKIIHSFNRASYLNKTRVSKAQVAYKTAFVDLEASNNVKFLNKLPTNAEFNNLVAQVTRGTYFKTKPIRFAAAHVVRIYKQQFNINLDNEFDSLHSSLKHRFNQKAEV